MKFLIKLVCSLIIIGGIGIGAVFYLTSGMTDEADKFFSKVKEGKIDNAYSRLSVGLKNKINISQLKSFLEQSLLSKYESASWSNRSFKNNTGKIEGTVNTTDNAVLPVTIIFVKEDGSWKIFGFNTNPFNSEANKTSMPSNDEIVKLVRDTTKVFVGSLSAKNMNPLHSYISQLWKEQISIQKLEEIYGSLYKLKVNWNILLNLSPVFKTTPTINKDGLLIVSGIYKTSPDHFNFKYKYIIEGMKWKLFGLGVNILPPEKSK